MLRRLEPRTFPVWRCWQHVGRGLWLGLRRIQRPRVLLGCQVCSPASTLSAKFPCTPELSGSRQPPSMENRSLIMLFATSIWLFAYGSNVYNTSVTQCVVLVHCQAFWECCGNTIIHSVCPLSQLYINLICRKNCDDIIKQIMNQWMCDHHISVWDKSNHPLEMLLEVIFMVRRTLGIRDYFGFSLAPVYMR